MAYQHPGIRPRRKGERRDPDLLKLFSYEDRGAPGTVVCDAASGRPLYVGTCAVVGAATGANPYNGASEAYELLEVTLEDGVVVPCYRLKGKPGSNYVICQDYEFKAVRPKAT